MAVLIETRLNALRLGESTSTRKNCLGRLEGVCADFKNPTRNGRLYNRQLWENVFSSDLFQEALKTKTLLGELDHPEDRFECLAKEACIVMTDYEFNDDEGLVYAGFDILDTPSGRILKSLLDYGCVMGVSSRGQGDIVTTEDGEKVDEDTYEFECFDVVTTPAVFKARPPVVEGLKKLKTATFTESIKAQISSAETVSELETIQKVLETSQAPDMDLLIESIKDKCNSIKNGRTTTSNDKKLQEALDKIDTLQHQIESVDTIKDNRKLYECINSLRQQTTAYKHRENRMLQVVDKKNDYITKLENRLKTYKTQLENLENLKKTNRSLSNKTSLLKSKISTLESNNRQSNKLITEYRQSVNQADRDLNNYENELQKSDRIIKDLQEQINSYKRDINTLSKNHNNEINNYERTIDDYIKKFDIAQNQLKENTHTINDYKKQLISLQEQLDNTTDKLQTLMSTNRQTESICNNLQTDVENADTLNEQLLADYTSLEEKYNALNEQYTELQSKVQTVNDKNRRLTNSLMDYQQNLLQTSAKQYGVNVNLVEKLIKPTTTTKELLTIIKEAQSTQDRYAKLPISDAPIKGTKILGENIKHTAISTEDADMESFITAISNSLL